VNTGIALLAATAAVISVPVPASGQNPTQAPASAHANQPWRESKLPPEARAKAALAAMTLDEKLRLVFGFSDQALTDVAKVPADIVSPELKNYVITHLVKGSAGFVPGVPREYRALVDPDNRAAFTPRELSAEKPALTAAVLRLRARRLRRGCGVRTWATWEVPFRSRG